MSTRDSKLTVLACAALVTASLLACKKKKAPTPATTAAATTALPTATVPKVSHKIYKVGDTGSALDYKLTVSNVKECKHKSYYLKPKKGNKWIGVEVLLESTQDKPFFANPGRAKVIDGDGIAYNATYSASYTKDCTPGLKTTQLAKGEKAKGWIVFEVPKKVSGLKMSYNPSLFGASQTIKFDLGI